MDEAPKYLMRFVGFKEDGSGELKPSSPAGYARDQLLELPFDYSLEPYWEIVDDIPDLVLPEEDSKDSVFEIRAEDGEISPPLKYVLPVDQAPEDVFVIDYESMTVKTLKFFIEQRGGKVERGWLRADLIREARELEEASRAASEAEPVEEEPEKTKKKDTPPPEPVIAVDCSSIGEEVAAAIDALEKPLAVEIEPASEPPVEEDPPKSTVDKQNELTKRYHDGEITADQYKELLDKCALEHDQALEKAVVDSLDESLIARRVYPPKPDSEATTNKEER